MDNQGSSGAVTTTGWIEYLSNVGQGVEPDQRIGRKFVVKSMSMRLEVQFHDNNNSYATLHDAVANANDRVRIIVFVDKQCNGAVVTISDLLKEIDGQVSIDSFRNMENMGRFKVLADKWVDSDNKTVILAGNSYHFPKERRTVNMYFKNLNIPHEFDQTTGSITGCRTNCLYLFAISDKGNTIIQYNVRIRFNG